MIPAAVRGADVGQMRRRIAFSERHPHVHITSPREEPTAMWGASWTDDAGTVRTILRLDLRGLLDDLEALMEPAASSRVA